MAHGSVGFEDWRGDRDCLRVRIGSGVHGIMPARGSLSGPVASPVFRILLRCKTNKMCV